MVSGNLKSHLYIECSEHKLPRFILCYTLSQGFSKSFTGALNIQDFLCGRKIRISERQCKVSLLDEPVFVGTLI